MRGSRWAAALAATLAAMFAVGGARPAAADVVACYDHEPYMTVVGNGYDHGGADGLSVTLQPFNPAWDTGDHWESLTLHGSEGDTFVEHPAAGVTYAAKGTLTGWTVCKGKDAVTTTSSPETTVPETTVPDTTAPDTTIPETSVPVTTVPASTPPTFTTTTRLPDTGAGDDTLKIAVALLVVGGAAVLLIRRRPAV